MNLVDGIRALRDFDIGDLSPRRIGSWPPAARVVVWVSVLAAVLVLGDVLHVRDLRLHLREAVAGEEQLKSEFELKAFQAANLDAYRQQMAAMEQTLGALASQLPGDAEVAGLLEDITGAGALRGLVFDSIELETPSQRDRYVELPIRVVARGAYHDIGAFVADIAALPRIVTLHDFTISQDQPGGALRLEITARTYCYGDCGGSPGESHNQSRNQSHNESHKEGHTEARGA